MCPKTYCTYIAASQSGTLYIGMTSNLYVRVLEHESGEIEGFSSKYKCDRLVYWEGFDDVDRAINRGETAEGMAAVEEDCSHRVYESALGRFGGEVGRADGVRERVDCQPMRTPCIAAGGVDGHGVLRLRKIIGFADDPSALRMTDLRRRGLRVLNADCSMPRLIADYDC